jgi:hypothetical protein
MQGFTVLKAHNFILNVLTIEQPVDVMQLVVTIRVFSLHTLSIDIPNATAYCRNELTIHWVLYIYLILFSIKARTAIKFMLISFRSGQF